MTETRDTERVLQDLATTLDLAVGLFRGLDGTIRHWSASEVRLAQAAKMEAPERLAGGVAHDFNNMP